MRGPLISVVLIFLNGQRYLHEAIESVAAQTHRNWELILVDDGSTDASADIAGAYAARHPGRVRCVRHCDGLNHGMSASRNLGVQHAAGEFVAFLDADDIWLRQKLECQLAHALRHPSAGMVCGPTLWWYSWSSAPEDASRDALRELGLEGERLYNPPELLHRFIQRQARTPATCSVLLRRQALDAVGGFEEAFRGMFEDQVFFSKVYRRVPVYVSSQYLDRYRQHGESHCAAADRDGPRHFVDSNTARQHFMAWLAQYVADDESLRQLLSRPTSA